MRRLVEKRREIHLFGGLIHPVPYFVGREPEVLGAEGDVLADGLGDELCV